MYYIIKIKINKRVQSFLNFSFQTIKGGKSHEIAAAFTFGREEIIPDMFIEIIQQTHEQESFKDFLWEDASWLTQFYKKLHYKNPGKCKIFRIS
mgnify:CR=1 FL=1